MKKPKNVKELCEFIWYLEDKYNLLDFEISGVKPWQAYRLEIYYNIGKNIGVFDNTLNRTISKAKKMKSFFNLLKNSLFHNTLFGLKKVDTLVFSHSRSKIVNNKYIDIYTKYLIDELVDDEQIKFLEFEEHYQGKHLRYKQNYAKYLDYITLLKSIKKRFVKIKLDIRCKKIIESVEKEIQDICKIEYNLENTLVEVTKKFKATLVYYDNLLQKTRPTEIYVVVSYGNGKSELIYLAKKYNIKVIELQHGTFSRYHLGYSFFNTKNVDYFPNEFWVWNEYWKNLINFPISKENIKIYPFKYLDEQKKKYNIKKIKNKLVILGQGGLTENMIKIILNDIKYFKIFNITIKLHPEEYGNYKNYKNLNILKNQLNITIIEDADLYQILSESEYQAGVFSTALYEGVEFECKTILFNLSGIEYMDKFIEYEGLSLKEDIYVS